MQHHITAGPQTGCSLKGAVTEKCSQHRLRPRKPQPLSQGNLPVGGILSAVSIFLYLPQRKRQHKTGHQRNLNHTHHHITGIPLKAACQTQAHDIGSCRCADTPEAVKPAHVAGFIVERHKVIQSRIHAACSQAIGNGPNTQLQEGMGRGKAKQGCCRHCNTYNRYLSCPKIPDKPVTEKAGNYGAAGNNHADNACIGHRSSQLPVHGRPC